MPKTIETIHGRDLDINLDLDKLFISHRKETNVIFGPGRHFDIENHTKFYSTKYTKKLKKKKKK